MDLGKHVLDGNSPQPQSGRSINCLPHLPIRACSRALRIYVADEISREESGSEAPPRAWEQCEANDEAEYAASSSAENATAEDEIKRPTQTAAVTPSSDRPSRLSLASILEAESVLGNREDRNSSSEAHLVPSVLSVSKEGTPKQPEEAPFAETEHQQLQHHQQEFEGDEPAPPAVSSRHAARGSRRARKSAMDATSEEASEQNNRLDEMSVKSEHSGNEAEAVAKEATGKHNASEAEIRPEEGRRDRHASSASSRHQREHRPHHHHKDRHKDHKVSPYVIAVTTTSLP